MKNSSKKALEKRGIISAGRAIATPGAQAHDDKRRANRKTDKQRLKREIQLEKPETARDRGPFRFGRRPFSINLARANSPNRAPKTIAMSSTTHSQNIEVTRMSVGSGGLYAAERP